MAWLTKMFSSMRMNPASAIAILNFLKKYWIFIAFFIFWLPAITSTITEAHETKNPLLPSLKLAGGMLASDQALRELVIHLEKGEINEIIGYEKPTEGLWNRLKWNFNWFFKIPFAILGLIYTIFFPAMIFYKIYRTRNTSEPAKNFFHTAIFLICFMFVMNTLFLIYNMSNGTYSLEIQEGTNKFKEMWLIFYNMLPFHGLTRLFVYVVGTITGTMPSMYSGV